MNNRIVFTVMVLALLMATQSIQAGDTYTVLRLSKPLIASGAFTFRLGESSPQLRPALQAEAGVGGGRLAIGYDNVGLRRIGYGFKVALLHTWLEPLEVDRDQTFLGLEAEFSARRLLISLGGFRRVTDGDDNWVVSAGLGFIF